MSFVRMMPRNFFDRWKGYSLDEKINHREFQKALSEMQQTDYSVYKGDGSEAFSQRIVAANCFNSGHVRNQDVFILRTTDGCLMIVYGTGNTGIDEVDRYHYNLGGLSQNKLLDIFNKINDTDVHQVTERAILEILVDWETKLFLTAKYGSIFSPKTLRRLEERGGGPYL